MTPRDDSAWGEPTYRALEHYQRRQGETNHSGDDDPIWIDSDDWDEADIPPRPWLAPGYLLRQALTLLVGAGGVSKSTLVLMWAVALATGTPFNRFRPIRPLRVTVLNCEDNRDEQRRRLSAALQCFGLLPEAIRDRVARIGPNKLGTLFRKTIDEFDRTIRWEPTAAFTKLRGHIETFKPDVIFVDPLIELHDGDENSNTDLRAVLAELRSLAVETDTSIVSLHHTRKGVAVAGDIEASRGASAIGGAVRVGLTLVGMTPEEASGLGISADRRRHFIRLDGAKANYSGLVDCEWFQRVTRILSNGDGVAVLEPWQPPSDILSSDALDQVADAVRRGSLHGPLSPLLASSPRSIKHAMVAAGLKTTPGQKSALDALLGRGFVVDHFRDPGRKWASGLRSPEGEPVAVWRNGAAEQASGNE